MNSLKTAFVLGRAGIAQLVEQLICNQQVVGSNPTAGSMVMKNRPKPDCCVQWPKMRASKKSRSISLSNERASRSIRRSE